MARIPTIQRKEQLAPRHQAVWDQIAASRGHVVGPFTVLLHSPELAARTAHLGAYVRFDSRLGPALREAVILTVAREHDCFFEWAAHAPLARQAGLAEATIEAIGRGADGAGGTEEERLAIAYVRDLIRTHRVPEATFKALQERVGVEALVELTATAGYYGMLAATLNAFDVRPQTGAEPLPGD